MTQYIPALTWLKSYDSTQFRDDLIAAVIVTILLIPQSLAYAMLAGVPPEVGLYASILPLIGYAIFGTSRTLSVGPVAVISLMTATSLGSVAQQLNVSYVEAATTLALLSGAMLTIMGVLRLGFITHFLSHAVISGFISASGIIIAIGQLKHIVGIEASGGDLTRLVPSYFNQIDQFHPATFLLGAAVIILLYIAKSFAARGLIALGLKPSIAAPLARTTPIIAVALSIIAVVSMGLEQQGVAITGNIPSGLPSFHLAIPSLELIELLWLPALLISIIGYVESVSVGRTLAAKRQQKVDPNQELLGLGAANLASGFSGAFPVTGGFARSVVNFDAGAVTQASSIMAAVGIGLAALFLTPALYFLPKATLAATIIVAVISLVDWHIFKSTWRYSRPDFWAVFTTVAITLSAGVEVGVASGVIVSIALHLYRTSKPHIAEIGRVAGTEHFRNVRRYRVETCRHLYCVRIDESLFFANASYLEDHVLDVVYQRGEVSDIVLNCAAVNEIDFSALEMLEALNKRLSDQGITLHLAEVKGPVLDRLSRGHFLLELSGRVFLTQHDAFKTLSQRQLGGGHE